MKGMQFICRCAGKLNLGDGKTEIVTLIRTEMEQKEGDKNIQP